MGYKVIHVGTGNVGRFALQAILRNPELELVGHYVNSPEKVGKDSGELIGQPKAGVTATNNWADLYDLGADCLIYFGDNIGREEEAIRDLVPFLERGTNAITFSGFTLAHPDLTPPHQRKMIDDACAKGNSTCFFTGMDPGWATTDLAIAALTAADQVDCVRVCELGYFGDYTAEMAMRDYFGFGRDKDFVPVFAGGGFAEQMWTPTLQVIADVLGKEIEEVKLVWETDGLDYDIETGFGPVKAGTTAYLHFELQALNDGKPFVIVEHVDSCTRDISKMKWKRPHADVDLAYRIEIEGSPSFDLELSWRKDGEIMSSMAVINAVPVVCAAEPGLAGVLDLPRYGPIKRTVRG